MRLPRFIVWAHLLEYLVTHPVEGPVGACGSGEVDCVAIRGVGRQTGRRTRGDTAFLVTPRVEQTGSGL